jgi:hypothetical protein
MTLLYVIAGIAAVAISPWVWLWFFHEDHHAPDDQYHRPFDDGGGF